MIYIDRNSITVPKVFQSRDMEIARKRLKEFYDRPINSRRQQRYSKPFEILLDKAILSPLHKLFRGKCAFCETIVNDVAKSEYDHFRPKSGARGVENEFAEDHYWWLTYEWRNFYLCCQKCNRYKSTWFPIIGKRAKLLTSFETIVRTEKPLLIDPCIDEPKEHLEFNTSGHIQAKTNRGKTTIDILKLNRSDLVESRIVALKEEFGEWERILRYWQQDRSLIKDVFESWQRIIDGNSEKSYLGIRRFLINDRLATQSEIEYFLHTGQYRDLPDTDKEEIQDVKYSTDLPLDKLIIPIEDFELELDDKEIKHNIKGHVYIESVELQNFKCFDDLKISFNTKFQTELGLEEGVVNAHHEPWMIFLGENGVGKSSVLQAIALCLMGENYRNRLEGVTPDSVLKNGKSKGFIKLKLVGEKKILVLRFQAGQKYFDASLKSTLTLMAGYGSIRVMPKGGIKAERQSISSATRAKNLFDYSIALTDTKRWLLKKDWNRKQFGKIAITLKDLLDLENKDKIIRSHDELFIARKGGKEKLEQQSDGYKTIIALAVDIMAFFMKEGVNFELAEGIVLIDELGAHLHPRWKMRIVDGLRSAFPRIQFIVTTHEPLCLRGVRSGEVTVMVKNAQRKIVPITELPDPSVMRVDQLLTSPFFGLSSAIDPDMEALFNEYYDILAKKDQERNKEERARLHTLQEKIPQIQYLGDTLREELALYVIDELIAKVRSGKIRDQKLKSLKPEVKKRVEDIWTKLDNENIDHQ